MKPKSSKYRGVSWHKHKGKWLAYIKDVRLPNGRRQKTIGIFDSELEAAQAYNDFARELRGEGAFLNELPADPLPPEPADIVAACAAIRENWSAEDYADRAPHWVGRRTEMALMPSTLYVELA